METRRDFLQHGGAAAGLALGGLALSACRRKPDTAQGMDFWKTVAGRRSVRQYKPDPVPEADIVRILDAARSAPTSGNQQPWKFLVIRSPETIQRLKEGCVQFFLQRFDESAEKNSTRAETEKTWRERLAGYFSAPAYIVVLTDNKSEYPDYNHWDCPLAAGNLALAARALGYGTVFITDVVPDQVTKSVLAIADRYTRVCFMPLGVPAEWPVSPPKKPLADFHRLRETLVHPPCIPYCIVWSRCWFWRS